MPSRLPYIVTAMLTLISSGSALAISYDANPWLAIENAVCVSHRAVDYSATIGERVVINEAQWLGAANGLFTHCLVAGEIGGRYFEVRLPTDWNGKIHSPGDLSEGVRASALKAALNQGDAVLFSPYTEDAAALLQAAVEHQYAAFKTEN